jgi:protein-S-isoprenylcysteine O-methyltransferase Ste14
MLFTAIKALVYGTLFVIFWGMLALSVRVFDGRINFLLPTWAPTAGIILMAAGGILSVVCVSMFLWIGNGTPAPFDPPKNFVVTGPYKYVRNPMYLGAFLMLPGFALYHRSVSMLLFWLLAIAISHFFVVFFEEKSLEKRYGAAYLEYKGKVNRWMPMRNTFFLDS